MLKRQFVGAVLMGASVPAQAQTPPATPPPASPTPPPAAAPQPDADGDSEATITVTGRKPPGSVVGDIPPEKSLSPAEIRSYGVSSISDLLDELAPETASGRGRGGEAPVVLLNGRRISSFSEIRDIPTEAILRVDILPEEVALKYGYRADQRVVNFVLRPFFRAWTGEANDRIATEGGSNTPGGEADLLHIRRDTRLNLDLQATHTSPLLESERRIDPSTTGMPYALAGNVTGLGANGEIDPRLSALTGSPVTVAGVPSADPTLAGFAGTAGHPNVTDLSPYRTLLSESSSITGNAVYATPLPAGFGATVNVRSQATETRALQGLPSIGLTVPTGDPFSPFGDDVVVDRYLDDRGPLTQRVGTWTNHLGLTVDKDVHDWRFSLTGNYDRAETVTRTDRGVDTSGAQALLDAHDAGFNPFGTLDGSLFPSLARDHARSTSNTGQLDGLATGPLFKLPAGDVSSSLRVGVQALGLDSDSTRAGLESAASISREIENGQLNLDVPLTSRAHSVLAFAGDLSLNANLALDHYSDFGTLKTIGYGAHWSPVPHLDLIASATDERGAPSPDQLADPVVVTPNARIFDFVRGQTVDVTAITGGNPNLTADHRRVQKLELTWRPPISNGDLSLSANYVHQTIRNSIASFPTATAQIEAAFPDRFQRDADGDLLAIDDRPVNFARETRSQLRWGVNWSHALVSKQQRAFEAWLAARRAGKAVGPPPGAPANWQPRGGWGGRARGTATGSTGQGTGTPVSGPPAPDTPPANGSPAPAGTPPATTAQTTLPPPPSGGGWGGGFGGGRGGGGRGGGGGGGRWGGGGAGQFGGRLQLAVYDTWYFKDEILIRDGVPVLDLLDGSATGNSGGQPRHQVDVQAGYLQNGLGARLSASWQSGTSVTATTVASVSGPSTSDDLRFHPLLTTNLRLFANVGQIPGIGTKHAWTQGLRVTVGIDNLLDRRRRVTDAAGVTPISYQPGYLDPIGRTIRISIRKLFFSFPGQRARGG